MSSSSQVPLTICWHCDRPLDAAAGLDGNEQDRPTPGAISLCLYCGAVAVFGRDLALLPPTEAMLDELQQDAEFRKAYVAFSWTRQYVMRRESLLRDRKDPDK